MSRVEEIEQAIGSLPPEDFRRLADWVRERDQALWDDQIDCDSVAGRLDSLFLDAEQQVRTGMAVDGPPQS
jgi:hypothetical protein